MYNSVRISLLNTAKKRGVEIGGIVCVAVSGSDEAGVDAGTITVPEVPVQIGDGLAGFDVDELAVNDDRDAGLFFAEVGADVLPFDPVLPQVSLSKCLAETRLNIPVQSPPQG